MERMLGARERHNLGGEPYGQSVSTKEKRPGFHQAAATMMNFTAVVISMKQALHFAG